MKKAQLTAQPFYYIFIMIVIAMILVFGFRIINNLRETQEQTKFVQFKTDLQASVNSVYLKNPGTKISYSSLLPKDVKQVCFKDFTTYTEVSAKSEFFLTFQVDNLIPKFDNYCLQAKAGKLDFTLENKILNRETIVEIS